MVQEGPGINHKALTSPETKVGSVQIEKIPGVNELFKLAHSQDVSLVRERGLEPPRLAALAPQASLSTYSSTRANSRYFSIRILWFKVITDIAVESNIDSERPYCQIELNY
jgi:hypothetical protein